MPTPRYTHIHSEHTYIKARTHVATHTSTRQAQLVRYTQSLVDTDQLVHKAWIQQQALSVSPQLQWDPLHRASHTPTFITTCKQLHGKQQLRSCSHTPSSVCRHDSMHGRGLFTSQSQLIQT